MVPFGIAHNDFVNSPQQRPGSNGISSTLNSTQHLSVWREGSVGSVRYGKVWWGEPEARNPIWAKPLRGAIRKFSVWLGTTICWRPRYVSYHVPTDNPVNALYLLLHFLYNVSKGSRFFSLRHGNETTYLYPYTLPLTLSPPGPEFQAAWGTGRGMLFPSFLDK